jgi:hypothetical protein
MVMTIEIGVPDFRRWREEEATAVLQVLLGDGGARGSDPSARSVLQSPSPSGRRFYLPGPYGRRYIQKDEKSVSTFTCEINHLDSPSQWRTFMEAKRAMAPPTQFKFTQQYLVLILFYHVKYGIL